MKATLLLKGIPKTMHINPLVFVAGCLIVVFIVAVLFYSVISVSSVATGNAVPLSSTINDDNDVRWYNQESTAKLAANRKNEKNKKNGANEKNEKERSDIAELSTLLPEVDPSSSKEADALLKEAIASPIKAPISDLSQIANTPVGERESVDRIHASSKENAVFSSFSSPDTSSDDVSQQTVKKPLSPFVLQMGTLLPATLEGSINSALPGQLTAIVNQNVYDSIRGHYLLVPQGSRLILLYDARIEYGQKRLLVVVKRIIFPNGASLNIHSMPAVDQMGQAGFHDQVDNHYGDLYGSAAMLGAITGGFQLSKPNASEKNDDASKQNTASMVMGNAVGEQIESLSLGMMKKNLEVAPEIIIRPGYPFNVQVTQDLVFPGPY